jgi:Sulfotransferase family
MSLPLVICGMHRSGTSLVASVLREAGLDIGLKEDVGLGLGQPRGHFEDRDFFDLHEAILAAAGLSCFTAAEPAIDEIAPAFEDRARALVAARTDRSFWGWKDPRTCLFLDLWERLLPQARYLFLYRHPVDVALSLWRRNTDLELRQDPWFAFRAWELYNRRLLALRDRYPERCFVAHAPALAADLPGFLQRLAAKLDLPLQGGDFHALYEPEELAPSCQPPRPAWEDLIPEALALYGRLEEIADLPSVEEPPASGRQLSLLQGSETLLYELLEAGLRKEELRQRLQTEAENELLEAGLREEELRRRLQTEAESVQVLRERLQTESASVEVLREIERSRTYAVVRAWWRLRRRLRVE